MNVPLVSIICSCFNHEKYVLDTLNAIKKLTYPNIQLIIIDDYSTDTSVFAIEEWLKKENNSSIQFIKNGKNLGLTKSVNHAFQYVKGEYYMDLAADDILTPNSIEVLISAFKSSSYSNLAIVYGNYTLIDDNSNTIENSQNFHVATGDIYKDIISKKVEVHSVSSLNKTSVFLALNGYDENLYFEDLDFWIRVSRQYQFDFTPEIIVKKRVIHNSLGDRFHTKSTHAYPVNNCIYTVLNKAYKLNRTAQEHQLLLKRIVPMLILMLKHFNIMLTWKFSVLYLKTLLASKQ